MNYRAMRYAIEQAAVEGTAWSVLVVIAYRADKRTGICSGSRRRIAQEARTSTSGVHRSLERLIKGGHVAIIVTGSGRRATTYQVLVPEDDSGSMRDSLDHGPFESMVDSLPNPNGSTVEPVDNPVVAPPGIVVAPPPSRSGSMVTPVYKEGREELRREELRRGVANSDAPPDGVAVGSDDPSAVVDEAVLAVDPDALRDPDGWNLSDRFGRAWLPNEDVAGWLRRYRKAASA